MADGQQMGPFEVIESSIELPVPLRRSKILRTKVDIYRTVVADPSLCEVVQLSPREVSIVGKAQGATDVTFCFQDPTQQPVTYLVRVTADPEAQEGNQPGAADLGPTPPGK